VCASKASGSWVPSNLTYYLVLDFFHFQTNTHILNYEYCTNCRNYLESVIWLKSAKELGYFWEPNYSSANQEIFCFLKPEGKCLSSHLPAIVFCLKSVESICHPSIPSLKPFNVIRRFWLRLPSCVFLKVFQRNVAFIVTSPELTTCFSSITVIVIHFFTHIPIRHLPRYEGLGSI
jgi:hypothetical protein